MPPTCHHYLTRFMNPLGIVGILPRLSCPSLFSIYHEIFPIHVHFSIIITTSTWKLSSTWGEDGTSEKGSSEYKKNYRI